MCHNAGRISSTGNSSSLVAKLYRNGENRQVAEMLSALFLCKKEHKMERYTTNTMVMERKGIFDKNRKKRFELTFTCEDKIGRASCRERV